MLLRMPGGLGERHSPLNFLAALGAGGLEVTFFMWLLFWVPYAGRPVPVFGRSMPPMTRRSCWPLP